MAQSAASPPKRRPDLILTKPRKIRQFEEKLRLGDHRNDFERDRDILIYSTAFRRLSGITQVLSPQTGHILHNRLTHTLQVAQFGRRLAEKLKILQPAESAALEVDPDVVETCCLAHDLGHPPFGHLAEGVLDRFASKIGGFEGNAQSFRIITRLAFRSVDYPGLNLTGRTLRATLKYPWLKSARRKGYLHKWGAYDSEKTAFEYALGHKNAKSGTRSAEAELMDWSDDVTYSVHDVEDFYRAGLIPIHLLLPNGHQRERERFLSYVWGKKSKIPELDGMTEQDIQDTLDQTFTSTFSISIPYEGTSEQRARLRTFTGLMINRYINAVSLVDSSKKRVLIAKEEKQEVAVLKQLTWFYVIDAPSLVVQQRAHKYIIEHLCKAFLEEALSKPGLLLPPFYRERLQAGDKPKRVVVDLIAGMSEANAIGIFERLNGSVVGTGLERFLL